MSLEWQKIIIRAVIVFTLVFGVVFVVLERGAPKYEGSSIFVVLAKSDVSALQMGMTTQNIEAILSSDAFRSEVSDARYAQMEEFPKFTVEVRNPAGSVFVLSYTDTSVDPFAVREAIATVRMSAIKIIAKSYDLSRDLSVQFLDAGTVVESHKSSGNIMTALIMALLVALAVEGGVFLRTMRESENAFRSAIEKRLTQRESSSEWWKNFESNRAPDEDQRDMFQAEDLPDDSIAGVPTVPILTKEEKIPSFHQQEVSQPKAQEPTLPVRSQATAPAPANLPIAMEIPEAFRPSVPLKREEVLPEEDEMLEDEVMVSDAPATNPSAPAVNPEPSVEELKARLNKLLRGEL